ncbi:MAG: McrB family protein, partial [Coriobacteriales bacterium]
LPEVYDPGLTTEDWAELIKDVDVFTHDTMTMLSRMAELGGQATCKEMSEAFGEHPSHYVSLGGTLGEKVVEKAGIPAEVKSDGKEQFWSIPFLGRSAAKGQPGTFCWKIRPELYDALMIDGVLPDAHAESGSEPACPHAGDSANQSELYSDADFLAEVYMDAGDFEDLKGLAKAKRNIILQGAPGTGKTFAAERLAWALMGRKDEARVQKVQFHQSTSYDEFVIGFRPNAQGGFAIEEGPFVRFCDRAAADAGNEYFLIIDEINRANVSKVFGELLMLIEDSHRGEELLLTAGKRMFSVPKNLTIIGMMNTADRGLALIDYALRRRFAFFEMEPALDNSAFKERVEACLDKRMPALVEAVRKLNAKIADDPTLGEGFRIGHSYFCRDKEKEPGCVDAIVKYELVPLVREYWFDDRKTAEAKVAKLEALL